MAEKEKYLVVPDFWKPSWGERPLLGIVYAEDLFEGERKAYEKELLPMNITFGPKLIKSKNQGRSGSRPAQQTQHQRKRRSEA